MNQLNQQSVIEKTTSFVKETLAGAEGGHDWWHIIRVRKLARHIAETEPADHFTVELGALLHDIADSKFHNGDEVAGPQMARQFLTTLDVDQATITHIEQIIANISFKGGRNVPGFRSPELDVIQDADRLDAMGAIGIARAFSYGGFKNREIYNPGIRPNMQMTREQYKNSSAPTINHFYEKLLLLKEKMNTPTGRALAEHRHTFMEQYLDEFYLEWDGNR